MKIADIQDREDLMLITDEIEVRETIKNLPYIYNPIDSLFIKIVDGEITEAYAFQGIIPYLEKPLIKIL